MDRYPETVLRRLSDLRHVAEPGEDVEAVGVSADFNCGASVSVSMEIDTETKLLSKVSFTSNACGFAVSFAEHVAESVEGRSLTGLKGDWQAECYRSFVAEVGPIQSVRMPCLAMVADAFGSALSAYRAKTVSGFEGDSPLVCSCFGVSEDVLVKILDEGRASTVSELTQITNAGAGCGSCLMILRELVESKEDGF